MAKFTFDNDKVYVGSTCETLELRLQWHKSNPKSQKYKNNKHNPVIELIINAPSNDKKTLEDNKKINIEEYAEKYDKLLINIRSNAKVKKEKKERKIEYQIDTEDKLRERIRQLKE